MFYLLNIIEKYILIPRISEVSRQFVLFKEGSLIHFTSTSFQKGPLNEQIRVKKSSFRCRRKAGIPIKNLFGNILDWKPMDK